ncbi:sigma 54-interacting transcriptional regulator [bacterium]|nr:sigma 54-interacting transcriptional regulator [bacterium]
MIELTPTILAQWDVLAEFDPPELLQQIDNYTPEDFSPNDWRRVKYFKGKALYTLHYYKEAEEIALECIRESIIETDYYILVKCHLLQAITYYSSDSEDLIRPLLNMAIDYAMDSGEYDLMIEAHQAYMFFFSTHSQFKQALKQESRILDLMKRVQPSYTTASALGSIALLYVSLSKWDMAIKYYLQVLDQAKSLLLEILQLIVLNNLGSALGRVNDFTGSKNILEQGLALAKKLNKRHKIFLFTSNLGNLMLSQSDYITAIDYYDQCMNILENVSPKPPSLLIDLYNNYSLCFWKLNDHEKSLDYVMKAIEIAKENNFERDLIQMGVNKTNLLVSMGKYDEAIRIVQNAVKYYKKANDLHQMIWVYRTMAHIYYLMKDYKKSYETERKLDNITDDYISDIQKKESEKSVEKFKVENKLDQEYNTSDYGKRKINNSQGFIGCSKAYHNVLNSALLAAQYQNTSVLILGESGTGKEIVAQLIHKNSLRKNQAFVPVNVGAISSSLVESELFGHTKGAYTGADTPTKGFFLQADKGSLFLDEIADMPFALQSKMLRVLESRKVTAVGSSQEKPFDCRIISATSQDLREKLVSNLFRLDLFHRLNTIEIVIPPLRERKEDIEPILNHYLKFYANELNKAIPFIDRSLLEILYTYDFPGNIRELKNIVERMYILSKKTDWDAKLLCEINPFRFSHDDTIAQQEYNEEDLIVKALLKAKGKQKEAALILNMSEATLSRRIIKYKLHKYTLKGM